MRTAKRSEVPRHLLPRQGEEGDDECVILSNTCRAFLTVVSILAVSLFVCLEIDPPHSWYNLTNIYDRQPRQLLPRLRALLGPRGRNTGGGCRGEQPLEHTLRCGP